MARLGRYLAPIGILPRRFASREGAYFRKCVDRDGLHCTVAGELDERPGKGKGLRAAKRHVKVETPIAPSGGWQVGR